jgi:7-cyano-7-deazaguanine synthase
VPSRNRNFCGLSVFLSDFNRTSTFLIAMQKKAVTVLFSGGIDSTSCLRFFSDSGHVVRGVFVDFGQASAKPEREAVRKLQSQLGLPVTRITATSGGTFGAGELVGRNAFLTFAAILLGGSRDGLLALGVHAGTSYYDCSPTFIDRLDVLVQEHTNGRLRVVAPFVHWTKDEVYSFFATLNLPLSLTYSCEAGTIPPCGNCSSCKDRIRFECSRNAAS